MATKTIKKVSFEERVDKVKENIADLNEQAILTTDKMVDISLESGAKWLKLMSKVIDKGTDLLERQQDLTLNVLEGVKGQYTTGNKQFRHLFGLNESRAKKAKKLQNKKRALARKAESTIDDLLPAKDNLKEVQGIGPKVEVLLNNAGIYSYEDLASASIESLQAVLQTAGTRYQSMDPTNWIKLAQEAVAAPNNK
ncbi:MAG: helix-hairpin-helix domain-containing protein [Bacteroidota bacterium]